MRFNQALHTPEGQPRLDYLVHDRGLTEETVARFQLGAVVSPEEYGESFAYQAYGKISIPYITPTGTVLIRYMQPPPRTTGAKYWQPAGSHLGLYNTGAVAAGGSKIVLAEGEVDAMTLAQLGLPVVGIPGAGNWQGNHHFPAVFDGFDEIIFCQDNDEADKVDGDGVPEMKGAERLMLAVKNDLPNVRVVLWPKGHDANSAYKAYGPDMILDLVKYTESRAF